MFIVYIQAGQLVIIGLHANYILKREAYFKKFVIVMTEYHNNIKIGLCKKQSHLTFLRVCAF